MSEETALDQSKDYMCATLYDFGTDKTKAV